MVSIKRRNPIIWQSLACPIGLDDPAIAKFLQAAQGPDPQRSPGIFSKSSRFIFGIGVPNSVRSYLAVLESSYAVICTDPNAAVFAAIQRLGIIVRQSAITVPGQEFSVFQPIETASNSSDP